MSIFVRRGGGISIVRVGMAVGLLGIALIAGGFVALSMEQAQRRTPFEVELYPSAQQFYVEDGHGYSRRVVYRVDQGTPEDIAAHYQARLDDHYRNRPNDPNRERCVRVPAAGQFQDYRPGSGNVPFYFRCEFDNSTFNAYQSTTVTIQPGVRVDAENVNHEGATFIIYDQLWSP
jgi:hypothetical protein